MTKPTHVIVGNYNDDTYDCYVKGWDRIFDPENNLGGMSIIHQIKSFISEELNVRKQWAFKAQVRASKKAAKMVGFRASDATIVIVDEDTKNKVCEHFAKELGKRFAVVTMEEVMS